MNIFKALDRIKYDIEQIHEEMDRKGNAATMANIERDEAIDLLCICATKALIPVDGLIHAYLDWEQDMCAFLIGAGRMEEVGIRVYKMRDDGKLWSCLP